LKRLRGSGDVAGVAGGRRWGPALEFTGGGKKRFGPKEGWSTLTMKKLEEEDSNRHTLPERKIVCQAISYTKSMEEVISCKEKGLRWAYHRQKKKEGRSSCCRKDEVHRPLAIKKRAETLNSLKGESAMGEAQGRWNLGPVRMGNLAVLLQATSLSRFAKGCLSKRPRKISGTQKTELRCEKICSTSKRS